MLQHRYKIILHFFKITLGYNQVYILWRKKLGEIWDYIICRCLVFTVLVERVQRNIVFSDMFCELWPKVAKFVPFSLYDTKTASANVKSHIISTRLLAVYDRRL